MYLRFNLFIREDAIELPFLYYFKILSEGLTKALNPGLPAWETNFVNIHIMFLF